jgi:hypothetical protein
MQQLTFETTIAAPAHKVWQVLWNDENYRKWTAVFSNSSHAESDWQQGSYVKFLDNNRSGLYSKIMKKEEDAIMQLEHIAELTNGEPIYDSEGSKEWKGAKETYTLKEAGSTTSLHILMDVPERYHDFFKSTFSQCVEQIKALSETEDN